MATECDEFALNRDHSEAKLNHHGCFRLLGRWQWPDHSSEVVSHPSSIDCLSVIFSAFFKK
jgi:hypothetical protein